MKTRRDIGGSASIIIISILFIALMAALGVVFYQNFIQKPTTKTTTTTSTEKAAPSLKTTRIAFNNVIYAMDYPDSGWTVTSTPGANASSMIAKNVAGNVQVQIVFSQMNQTSSCNPSDGLHIGSYSVSDATAKQLIGVPLYLVSTIYDHTGGGYQYAIGLSPDSGNTHATAGGSHCDVSSVGAVSPAVLNGTSLVQPAIEATITFPKLSVEPKPASPDMQTIKNLMNSDDYKAAVKILESARKE